MHVFDLSFSLSLCQLEQSWAQRLQEAEEEVRKARRSDSREGAAGLLISVEELEDRLSAQKETLQQEAVTAQARAVEEAVRDAQREMQQKHTDDITLQVFTALNMKTNALISNLLNNKDKWSSKNIVHIFRKMLLSRFFFF